MAGHDGTCSSSNLLLYILKYMKRTIVQVGKKYMHLLYCKHTVYNNALQTDSSVFTDTKTLNRAKFEKTRPENRTGS